MFEAQMLNLAIALGIGLLIGLERERRNKEDPGSSAAGIRTFSIAALAGAVGQLVGGVPLTATVTGGVALMAAVSFWRARGKDPGLTSEVALVATVLLAALAMEHPTTAAAVAVTVAILLAARTRIHHFVNQVLTTEEIHAALGLAAATLVILPLLPDRPMGPYGALNPYSIWRLVVLVLAIGAAGHIAVRLLGARFGLPVAGLASGFVSSSATIGAFGARAVKTPAILPAAVAGRGAVDGGHGGPDGRGPGRHQPRRPCSPWPSRWRARGSPRSPTARSSPSRRCARLRRAPRRRAAPSARRWRSSSP